MVKLASLMSQTVGALILQMRMRAWVVCGRFTFQACEPPLGVLDIGVLDIIVLQLPPPFLERSILTLPTMPIELQLIIWVLLFVHTSPPLGEATVIEADSTPVPVT